MSNVKIILTFENVKKWNVKIGKLKCQNLFKSQNVKMSKFILTSENDKKWNVITDNIMQQNNYKQAAI